MTAPLFCVVIHDVAPVFAREVDVILERLGPLAGRNLSAAVVPCWHGQRADAVGLKKLRDWDGCCGEVLLHGWTHRRDGTPGLISWLTNRADEFRRLSQADTVRRLTAGVLELEPLRGERPRGFVPPAWQFAGGRHELSAAGLEYVLGFHRLVPVRGAAIPLATWSWDWGWFPASSRPGSWLGGAASAWNPAAVPVVAVHPRDVHTRSLPHAVQVIDRFLQKGYRPALPSRLLEILEPAAVERAP